MRRAARCLAVLAGLLPATGLSIAGLSIADLSAPALAEDVDLELVLAVDISGSVDHVEAQLQRQGYLKALVDPRIVGVITGGERRRVAIAYMEWAGAHYQNVVAGWTVVRDMASARAFAAAIAGHPVTTERWTSISTAIDFALGLFRANPHRGTRKVLDISGDGKNNNGGLLEPARVRALKAGVTINGLPIVNDRPNPWGYPPPRDLDRYYFERVIGGPGAFIVVARGFRSFGDAVKAKLALEIAGAPGPPVQFALRLR